MFSELITIMMAKSIRNDLAKSVIKNEPNREKIIKEKLGVSSIDEFMKKEYTR